MAAEVLSDILSNFLTVDVVLQWLSNKRPLEKDDVFLKQYECSQIEFVSYFLIYLREQCSRDFEVYDAETPRKSTYSRKCKNDNSSAEQSSAAVSFQNSSINANHLDLESLQSFPTLSSCSSTKIESVEKAYESAQKHSLLDSKDKANSEKKLRVKLFSETLEGSSKDNDSSKKDIEFLDDIDVNNESKIAISTPKSAKDSSFNMLPITDYFSGMELQEVSPKFQPKQQWKNRSSDYSSPEINVMPSKSKSCHSDPSSKNKDNKINYKMSLGDFILKDFNSADSKKEKKNKAKKRINPVKISNQSTQSTYSALTEKTDDSLDNTSKLDVLDDSLILNAKCQSKTNISKKVEIDMDSKKVRNISNSSPGNEAELELVTFTNELKILSKIYSFLINENFCQNIMVEFCFITSLLVIQDYDKKMVEFKYDLNDKKLFGSIHNCVYFAVETLWLQRHCLPLLNLSALKLLQENNRIGKFNTELKAFLSDAYHQKQSNANEDIKKNHRLIKLGMQGNVSFQYETDSRENFTSNVSFHSFRKQRDLFYNILAIWEANHLVSGWIFSTGLASKIRTLFSLSSDPINLLHLARLFRNQLVTSCCGENQTGVAVEEDFNEEILQLLPSADPNKILRLRARLTSSSKRQGPCPLPDFTGHQEFYKEFIICTNHSAFHEHLKNSLCDEILRLNDTDLMEDVEDEESSLDEQTLERYLQCTNILRLLAKFLGFVEFMPYRGEKTVTDQILNIHCAVRHHRLPLFDVTACLESSLKKQKLILTIPWVVSYLSMIDSYSAHLTTYSKIWQLLIIIYKQLNTFKNVRNGFYLKLTMGWMFQLSNFPPDQFYGVLNDCNKSPIHVAGNSSEEIEKRGVDFYDFVDEIALYSICPYLNEINMILSENVDCNVRHIKPVTTQESSFTKSQASKQLELRLEGNFLHNQSSSTRRTVEFVTERVASIAIKHLVHNVIPDIKRNACAELENFSHDNLRDAETAADILSESCYKKMFSACENINWETCLNRSETALKALLSDDLHKSVAETCAKIVARQATEKVERWMQSHVTLAMIKKEFFSIIAKKFSKKPADAGCSAESAEVITKSVSCKGFYNLSITGRGVIHEKEAWPASKTIKAVRDSICTISEGDVVSREVELLLEETVNTINHRNDIIPAAVKALLSVSLDLVFMYCVHSNGEDICKIFEKFSSLLKSVENHFHSGLERIVCPRNVAIILKEAKKKDKAWQNLSLLLLTLLKDDLLSKEQLETQLLSLLRQNWRKVYNLPEDGAQFLQFISIILDIYSKDNGCDKFSLLLEYMIETLNDDESKTDSLG